MWPKMLFELLPHLARLVPMADKFFATRTASEKANEAALAALAESVRGDLGQMTQAHGGLDRRLTGMAGMLDGVAGQLEAQALLVAQASEEAVRARTAAEAAEVRLGKLEETVEGAMRLVMGGMALLVVVLVFLVVMVFKVSGR